jgi:hypothetical protein
MRTTTSRLVVLLAMATLAVCGSRQACAGQITYSLVEYRALPPFPQAYPATLSGSITGDFSAWAWAISYTSLSASSTDPGSFGGGEGLVINLYEIAVPRPTDNVQPGAGMGVAAGGLFYDWYGVRFMYSGGGPNRTIPLGPPIYDADGNLIIALSGLPEPASILLLGTAALCGVAYGAARTFRWQAKGQAVRSSSGRRGA